MIQRIRDKFPNFRPTETIKVEDWDDIRSRFLVAKKFNESDNPIRIIMEESLKNAESMILENRIKEVREEYRVTKELKKIFITPKKVQDDEVVGQIKLLRMLFKEIQSWIDRKENLELREAKGEVVIQHSDEKRA